MSANRVLIVGAALLAALLASLAGRHTARACTTHGLVHAATLDAFHQGQVGPIGAESFWIGIEDRLIVPGASTV